MADKTPSPHAFNDMIAEIDHGKLHAHSLFEVDEVERLVFAEIRDRVIKETTLPLFAGVPEAPST